MHNKLFYKHDACTLVTYTLKPSEVTVNFPKSNGSDVNGSSNTVAHKFSFSIHTTMEGMSSYSIRFCELNSGSY